MDNNYDKQIEAEEIEKIEDIVRTWVSSNISKDFKFRKYQLETIIYIIKSIVNDMHETTIIEAPTGSGKSLICIIAAGVLSKYYNKSSYILCSDLFLWQQYREQIDEYKLKNFGYLKGTIGNYTCDVNRMDLSTSKCKLSREFSLILRDELFRKKKGYNCFYKCKYMQQRVRAEKSPVTLLTYQLWLHHMNNQFFLSAIGNPPFGKRDVIFCDECHNIPDIVQQFCSHTIVESDKQKLFDILDYAKDNEQVITDQTNRMPSLRNCKYIVDYDYKTKRAKFSDVYNIDEIKYTITNIFDSLNIYQDKPDVINDILILYRDVIVIIEALLSSITGDFSSDLFNTNKIDEDVLKMSKLSNWMNTYAINIATFVEAICDSGKEFLLLETSKDNDTGAITYSFKCAKEDFLCYSYLMKNSTYKIMTSATVGGHASFDENIGIKYTDQKTSYMIKLPSTFDFEKSPIYYIPTYKMNYANKNESFPKISIMAEKIISANNCKGIVHTGSYENARIFYNSMPNEIKKRLLLYGDSRQKEVVMNEYKESTNKVLVGPTLTEGIDLPNDLCRFIILMKVPYPNITGKLVKKKIELFPLWYNSTTSNAIIQGIGRGVRSDTDWCRTYILDGCFSLLYQQTKDQYPKSIQERIKFINP